MIPRESKKPCSNRNFRLAASLKIHNSHRAMTRYLPLCIIVGLLIVFRALGSAFPETLPNFQPLAALFFCGALLATGWRGFAIPLGVWAVTYPLGIGHTSSPAVFLTTLIALTLVFFLGKKISNRGMSTLLVGSIAAAITFHLVTNGAAWLGDPRYAKSLGGFWQSMWTGAPGDVLPSWIFLRNMTAANLIFTSVFLTARIRLPKATAAIPAPAYAKSH